MRSNRSVSRSGRRTINNFTKPSVSVKHIATSRHKSIEKPQRYRLLAKWETLESYTVDFRGSPDFAEWRALFGSYFAAAPDVEHTKTVVTTEG